MYSLGTLRLHLKYHTQSPFWAWLKWAGRGAFLKIAQPNNGRLGGPDPRYTIRADKHRERSNDEDSPVDTGSGIVDSVSD